MHTARVPSEDPSRFENPRRWIPKLDGLVLGPADEQGRVRAETESRDHLRMSRLDQVLLIDLGMYVGGDQPLDVGDGPLGAIMNIIIMITNV